MRFLNPLGQHVETPVCLGLRNFFRICRPTSVGTKNPEIKVDLYTATMTVYIQPLSATKNHVTT